MGLNKSTGNMYDFITHTWNTVKGECFHNCSYCYMKRFKNQKAIRFDETELKSNLGKENFIFVGSSNDMFADNIQENWIATTLEYINLFKNNRYLFQTKNPKRLLNYLEIFKCSPKFQQITPFIPIGSALVTTIETNKYYEKIMGNTLHPFFRSEYMAIINFKMFNKYITIEPIMDFDLEEFVEIIKLAEPIQVNIGADSCGHHLPEPPKEKILDLIQELKKFTIVHQKNNLKRLLK